MRQHGGDIYDRNIRLDFSVNTNPWGMPAQVRRAAIKGVRQSDHYPDVQNRLLLNRLAEYEGVQPGQILCGNGAAELIYALSMAAKPEQALLMAPTFSEYENALAMTGCDREFFMLQEARGFRVGAEYLEALHPDLDQVWICNPGNPTGTVLERELLEQVISQCASQKTQVIIDECFMDFLDQPDNCSMVPLLEQYDNLVILKAFTKLYAMPGLRLGYMLTADEALLHEMRQCLQPWNISIPAQAAGMAALGADIYRRETLDFVRSEREFLKAELRNIVPTVYDSQANYILFRGNPGLWEQCLKYGILIRDCSNYRGLAEGYYRVAVKRREENEELLRVLKKIRMEEN